jgi:hypothetical protein
LACPRDSRAYGSRESDSMGAKHAELPGGTQAGSRLGRASEKGRPVSRAAEGQSGQPKGSPPPARLPRTGSDESQNYRPAQAGEIGNITTRVYTDAAGGASRSSWAAHRSRDDLTAEFTTTALRRAPELHTQSTQTKWSR